MYREKVPSYVRRKISIMGNKLPKKARVRTMKQVDDINAQVPYKSDKGRPISTSVHVDYVYESLKLVSVFMCARAKKENSSFFDIYLKLRCETNRLIDGLQSVMGPPSGMNDQSPSGCLEP